MCGISGYIGVKNLLPTPYRVKSCLKLMKLRGPDFQDSKKFNTGKISGLICSSRLSIIDNHERSNQPFEDENGILSFNGEIYNYLDLKKDLKNKKISFKTKSDTEVLLKYLNYYGINKLNEIHGMWGFAYYSKKKKKFYLCRDKFGEKPVFYSLDKKKLSLTFGSNINYIRTLNPKNYKINKNKIYNYLRYGFRSIFSEYSSFFENINLLGPGEIIEIDSNFNFKNYSYLKLKKYEPKIKNFNLSKKILKNKINEILPKTFNADVPVAFLLSGGIDSSILSYIAKKNLIKTKFYSWKNKDQNYDEEERIKSIIKKLKLNHEFIKINNKSKTFGKIKKLIKDTGYPLLSSSNLAINEICKKAKKDGYKVIMSGHGADEMFGGYYAHYQSYFISIENTRDFKKNYMCWERNTKPFVRTEVLKNFNLFKKSFGKNSYNFENDIYENYFKVKKKIKIIKKKTRKKNKDTFINHLDKDLFYDNFPVQAHSTDNISMHNSIESRAPFANHYFYNLRNNMSKSFLVKNGLNKFILRDIYKKKIPKEILFNPNKIGFFVPLSEVLNLKSKKFYNVIFKNAYLKKIIKLNLIKKKYINNQLTQQDQKFIFYLYNIATFMKLYAVK